MASIKAINDYLCEMLKSNATMENDPDGIDVLLGDFEVKKILVALDTTSEVLDHAKEIGANLLLTHHPLVFRPVKNVSFEDSVGKRIIKAIQNNVSVISFHTRLDTDENGVNTCLADTIGMVNPKTFANGFGKIASLEKETPISEYVRFLKEKLCTDDVIYMSATDKVKTVACSSGNGGDSLYEAHLLGADTYVTGEAKYSVMLDAKEYGMNIILGTHFETEAVVLPALKKMVNEKFPDVEIVIH